MRCSSQSFVARALAITFGLLAISLPSLADTSGQVFVKTYRLNPGGQFVLDNVNGSVHVDGWDRDEVEVRAVKTAQADPQDVNRVRIEIESNPCELDVHTRYPEGVGADVAVEYHIHVPNRVLLGSVHTVNGSLIVRGVNGGGELRSVNGDVEVLQSSGRFNAKTTNGNLRLRLRHLNDGEPMNLQTVNGSVELGLPWDARADLSVHDMNGELYSEVPVTSTADMPGSRSFRGKLGHGGGAISVSTVNGGIRLLLEHGGV
jgi:DUF4097 and DUF4098 domain-containing protein YvlB